MITITSNINVSLTINTNGLLGEQATIINVIDQNLRFFSDTVG